MTSISSHRIHIKVVYAPTRTGHDAEHQYEGRVGTDCFRLWLTGGNANNTHVSLDCARWR